MSPTLSDRLQLLERAADDLLEAHHGRSLDDFAQYRDRPAAFMREVLHFNPWSKQEEVAQSVVANKRTLVRGCHGAGKDAVLAALMLWAAYARGMRVIAISATERQLVGQLWAEVRRQFSSQLPGELFATSLRIGGEQRITAMTSGSVSNLTGWHEHSGAGVFVAISESQAEQVEAAAFDAASGNTVDDASRVCCVGNPIRCTGAFFEAHSRPTWAKVRISAFDHPNVREARTIIPGGPSASWPQEMAAEYGEDSAFYVSRVLGEFPMQDAEHALVTRRLLEASADRWEEWRRWAREPYPSPRDLSVGIDVGRTADRTVLAVRRGDVLTELRELPRADLMTTAERIAAELKRIGAGTIDPEREPFALGSGMWQPAQAPRPGASVPHAIVDVVGIGAGVHDRLIEVCVPRVVEFNGGAAATGTHAERFANARAAAYWRLRDRLVRGEVALPRHAQLWDALLATDWAINGSGRIQLEAKELVRRKLGGRSPDHADAVAMAFTEVAPVAQVSFCYVRI